MKKLLFLVSAAAVAMATCAANRTVRLSNTEYVAIFDEVGTFALSLPSVMTGRVDVLVVGGGGGGGFIAGGGGGGGQVVYTDTTDILPGDYTVTVGAGGAGGTGSAYKGGNGGTSSLSGLSIETISALGGGGGGGAWAKGSGSAGANGGGGGGGSGGTGAGASVEGGHKGGGSTIGERGGGGGGAGGDGQDAYTNELETAVSGNGGPGITNAITGVDVVYGPGGGAGTSQGWARSGQGFGGAMDGCGDGANYYTAATPARDGVGGGGGGGGGGNGSGAKGSVGGSGTVIVRYAVDNSRVALTFTADVLAAVHPFPATFTAEILDDSLSPADATFVWDFGDGTPTVEVVGSPKVTHVYSSFGYFDVTVNLSIQGKSATTTRAQYISSFNPYIYADVNATGSAYPYGSRETAASNLTDAVNAILFDGQTLLIKPGMYKVKTPCSVSNAVAVIGEGASPEDVVVTNTVTAGWGDGTVKSFDHGVFKLLNAGGKIENLTVTGGSIYYYSSACGIDMSGGLVTNCIIRGCVDSSAFDTANGVNVSGGILSHCIIEDCHSANGMQPWSSDPGGASGLRISGGRAENCLVRRCYSPYRNVVTVCGSSAVVDNLTIADGYANKYIYSGTYAKPAYGVYLTGGMVRNTVIYNIKTSGYDDVPAGENRAWGCTSGKASGFVNCATDTDDPINETCKTITSSAFRNYADGDLRPALGEALVDAGADVPGWTKGSSATDLALKPRVQGRTIDIGCYECNAPGLMMIIK